MNDDEPVQVTLLVIAVLEGLGVRYLLAGSLASAIYGEPRSTRDADILAELGVEHVAPLVQLLESQFYVAAEAIEDAVRNRSSFNVIHYNSLFKVDIFLPKARPFDEQELQRRVRRVLSINPERSAFVASAEDVVLAKLDWFRQGGEVSEQQWRDVTGVIKSTVDLDIEYLRRSAQDLNVSDLLELLLSQVELDT
ncbi:MAG: hypothetical protein U0105_03670 [Candidatus Obscuribacterales bacterium]